MAKSKRIQLAGVLGDQAEEAVPQLTERMPTVKSVGLEPVVELEPTSLKVKKIQRVGSSVRLTPQIFDRLEELLEGKRRGVWIEQRMAELFESRDDEALLTLVVDRSEAELRVEDQDSGERVFSVRLDQELTERVALTAKRLECERSLVFRAWLCEIVGSQS